MPLDVADAALDRAASSGLPFHVQIAGGEPLLAPDVVRNVITRIRTMKWPAGIGIQTNATTIDPAMAVFLAENQVQVGVSIDGVPTVHEKLRGQSAKTMRGLQILSDAHAEVRITAVVTRENVESLPQLVVMLALFPNVVGFGLDPVVERGAAARRPQLVASADQLDRDIPHLLDTLDQTNQLRGQALRWRERDKVARAMSGDTSVDFCHACRGESLAVAPDGSCYPCSQAVGDAALCAGHLGSGTPIDADLLLRAFPRRVMVGPCDTCVLQNRCPQDCPSRLSASSSTEIDVMCHIYRFIAAHDYPA